MTETILFQDDLFPRVVVTPFSITVENVTHSLEGVTDVRYDIRKDRSALVSWGGLGQWPHFLYWVVPCIGSLLFPPLALVGIAVAARIMYVYRDRCYWDVVQISFIRSGMKIVCYKNDLPKPPDDRRPGAGEIVETDEEYRDRCERYKNGAKRAEAIVKAIGDAMHAKVGL